MAKSPKPKKIRARLSFATVVLIGTLLAGFAYQVDQMQTQVAVAQTQYTALEQQVNAQIQLNESLQAAIDEGGTVAQMEDIAREELGLVSPGEKVFYDVSN